MLVFITKYKKQYYYYYIFLMPFNLNTRTKKENSTGKSGKTTLFYIPIHKYKEYSISDIEKERTYLQENVNI